MEKHEKRMRASGARWGGLSAVAVAALAGVLICGASSTAYAQFDSGSTGVHGTFPPVPAGGMPNDAWYIIWNVRTGLVRYCSAYPDPATTRDEQCLPSATTNVTVEIEGVDGSGVYHFQDFNVAPLPGNARWLVIVGYTPNTPVSILSQTNITFGNASGHATAVYLSGLPGKSPPGTGPAFGVSGGRGGPGGFDGGLSGSGGVTPSSGSTGLGPSGGAGGQANAVDLNATFGTIASAPPLNPSLTPLSGGSGGGGGAGAPTGAYSCGENVVGWGGGSGGGGGGALLLAATGSVSLVSGVGLYLQGADGGGNVNTACRLWGGGGGGGSLRVVATSFTGSGSNTIFLGGGFRPGGPRAPGGFVRIETPNNTYAGNFDGAGGGSFLSTWQTPIPTNLPTLRITAIGGEAAPPAPSAALSSPDITFDTAITSPVTLNVAASNVPLGTTVNIKVVPAIGTPPAPVQSTALAGTLQDSTAQAVVTLPPGPGVVTASATFDVGTGGAALALNALPLIDGERPTQVEVVAGADGRSRTYLVARSGARFEIGQALQ